jgi:Nucleotidyl transferase AbiEii toxin, Type IV TA system
MNQLYLDTARLLTQVAPLVFDDDTFALKGGTAINLFIRDMPRLSVDLNWSFPITGCREIKPSPASASRFSSRPNGSRRVASRRECRPLSMRPRPSCWCAVVRSK